MKCPVDNETLLMTERQGVEIDYCPKCRGIWLDRGELDKLIEIAASKAMPPVAQAEPARAEAAYASAPPPLPPAQGQMPHDGPHQGREASAMPRNIPDPKASPAARASERMGFDQFGRRAPVPDPSDPRAPGNWGRKRRDDDDDDDDYRDDHRDGRRDGRATRYSDDEDGRGRKRGGLGNLLGEIFDF